ncbi:tape measure protein [Campylobacter showae]|uniref:tape measure protein n=1 Tax=Campylobacter showae TaxID=204 RepID=UPI003C6FD71A
MTETASLIVSARVEGADRLESDLNRIRDEARRVEGAATRLSGAFTTLKTAIGAVAGSMIVREFIQVSDSMSLMDARLKKATDSMAEFAAQQKALHAIARDTHADIKDTTDLYVKLAPALKDLGKSTDEINKVTSSFTKALQLGGASAEEAAAAIKQFGQAMGSGALKGDEFNSIAEASPTLMRYFADGLGVPIGKLKELASQGKLTAEAVSDALLKMNEQISKDAAQMPVTVGDAFTDLKTEMSLLVAEFDKAAGATGGMSQGLETLADWIKDNRSDIVEFGLDVYRSFQLMGTAVIWLGLAVDNVFSAIPTAIALAIDTATTTLSNGLNSMIAEAEESYNSIASLWGGETRFGRIDISTNISDGLMKHRKELDEQISLTQETMKGLLKDIAEDTTANAAPKIDEKFERIEKVVKKTGTQAGKTKEQISALNRALSEMAQAGMDEYEKKIYAIKQKTEQWIKAGVNAKDALRVQKELLDKLQTEQANNDLKAYQDELNKKEEKYQKFLEDLGEYEEAWKIERQKINKDYLDYVEKYGEEKAKKWLNTYKSNYLGKFNKHTKAAFKDIKNSWADTVSSMSKTVDDGFFNFFIGKAKSLKTALKDIGTNLMRDLISPYARTLSQGIAGGFGALLGGGSNLASVAAGLGLAKNDRGGWDGTIGGTTVELSSTGQILRGADALDKSTTNLLGSISNLKTAYDTFTGSITSGFTKAGGYLANAGFGGAGAFTHGFGNGIGTLFGAGNVPAGMTPGITSGMGGSYLGAGTTIGTSPYYTAGTAAGGAMVGGAVGYGIGTGLDKAFGAQTYAPYTGAAAGAAVGGYAAIAGSLSAVPVWGWIAAAVVLAIGGMIGKSKITDWGYQVGQDLSLGLDKGLDGGVNNWKEKTKKSWFSKSVSNQTSPIDEQTQKMLNQYVRTNSVLLKEFTGGDFNLPARTYNKRTLIDEGFGGALIAGVMGKNYDKALSFGGNEGELEKTYRYWMEQAKQDKKETYDLLAEYVGKINSNIKNLKLESLNNSLEKMKFANDEALDALKTLNSGLGAFSNDIDHVGRDMAGQIEKAYREALKNDFSKETIQRYEALTEAYKKAKQAQDEYLKAVLNFTQSIAGAQGGFYQALGFDTNFLTLQNLYTRLRNIAGALESDLGDKEKSDVAKIGSSNDPRVWAKYFHDMGSAKLQEFLSSGNVEMRAELVKLAAEYRTFTAANGGRDVWLKSFSDIEEITKQIAALKLAEAAQNTLNLQRDQLNLLNKQKSILEKIAQTAQKLRDSVIDSSTSELNYRFALERARIAYNAKDYDSPAYENLNTAVAKQEQFLKQTASSYAEYKLSILKMASEIEGITGAASLDDINRQIKRLEGLLNSSSNSQLSALEAQKEALIKGASDQINAMELLLGVDSPIVRYLKEALAALKDGKAVPNYNGTIANVNNGAVTANGAVLSSQLDRDINAIYKDVLGRSVEQSGLDAWKRKALMENLSLQQIREQIIKTATAITGSSNKNDWIEWSKRQGLKPYAEGGIVTRPTRALIGEAGAEAVIPLKNGAVRAQIVGGDNSELVSLMREGVYLMKEINKNTKEGTMVLKDVTNGTEFMVKAV